MKTLASKYVQEITAAVTSFSGKKTYKQDKRDLKQKGVPGFLFCWKRLLGLLGIDAAGRPMT